MYAISQIKLICIHCILCILEFTIKNDIIAKANKRLFFMNTFKYRISRQALITYCFGFILPIVEYGDLLFDSVT